MIFRLSQRLNAQHKAGTLAALPLDENPFADWSAHLFVVDRTQYILVSNTKSLYSTVIFGKGVNDSNMFIDRAIENLRALLADDGQQFVYRQCIAPSTGTVQFAKAFSRVVTSSINELVLSARAWLEEGVSPYEAGFRLNDVLLSAIAPNKAAKYGKPREASTALVSGNV